ncbi:MAG: hypothetical protein OEL55_02705 [Desulfobulbaceae bacterium]|nr:hypothetical protein [Desulfobulbaceae bacterium]
MGALLSANRVISGGVVTDGGGLNADFADVVAEVADTIYRVAGNSLALTGAAEGQEQKNWLYIDNVGDVTVSTSQPTGDYVPLALVDTNDTAVIRIADLRPFADQVDGIVENDCINGPMTFWQRAGSQTTNGCNSIDRFRFDAAGGTTFSLTKTGFLPGEAGAPDGQKYFASSIFASGNAVDSYAKFQHAVLDVRRYAGKRVCVAVRVHSSDIDRISIEGEQDFGTEGSPTINTISPKKEIFSADGNWHKLIHFIDFPLIEGKTVSLIDSCSRINFWVEAGSNYDGRTDTLGNQSGTVDFSDVEIYISNRELPVRRRTEKEEEHLCQAFYWQGKAPGGQNGHNYVTAVAVALGPQVCFPVKMVQVPSIGFVTAPTYSNCAHASFQGSADSFQQNLTVSPGALYRASGGTYYADAEVI